MNIKNRLTKLEESKILNFDGWLASLSDAELEAIANSRGRDETFGRWLETLTDGEIKSIRYGKSDAKQIRKQFNRHYWK